MRHPLAVRRPNHWKYAWLQLRLPLRSPGSLVVGFKLQNGRIMSDANQQPPVVGRKLVNETGFAGEVTNFQTLRIEYRRSSMRTINDPQSYTIEAGSTGHFSDKSTFERNRSRFATHQVM